MTLTTSTYSVARVLGNHIGRNNHHNNKWSVYKIRAGASTGREVFVAAGTKARERAEYVREMVQRDRTPDEERFLQRLLNNDKAADRELRAIVGA